MFNNLQSVIRIANGGVKQPAWTQQVVGKTELNLGMPEKTRCDYLNLL